MKSVTIRMRVATDTKEAIVEASKDSESMSAWMLEKLLPHLKVKEPVKVDLESSPIQYPIRVNRCMASHCKSMETTSKLVHGSTVWLCTTHYDKG